VSFALAEEDADGHAQTMVHLQSKSCKKQPLSLCGGSLLQRMHFAPPEQDENVK